MPQFSNAHQAEEFSDYLKDGLDWVFEDTLESHDKTFSAWLATTSADEFREDGIVITGLGAMPEKPVGSAITVDKVYTSSQKEFELVPFAIATLHEYELIRWDRYGVFEDVNREMARSAVDRCNITAYAIFNNGFSTADSVYTVYNSEALFDTAHVLLGGGTTTNRSSSDAALTYSAMQDARTDFMLLKNERGRYVRIQPKMLTCHPSNEWYADTLIGSSLRPGTANNDKNVLPKFGIHSSPYLTATDAWFLTGAKNRLQMKFCEGDAPKTRQDFDHATWNTVRTCYQSHRVDVLHYQGTWGSQGDGAI